MSETTTPKRSQLRLPELPAGYEYSITIRQPGGINVTIEPSPVSDPGPFRSITELGNHARVRYYASIPDALRETVGATRKLAAAEDERKRLEEAGQKALDAFGEIAKSPADRMVEAFLAPTAAPLPDQRPVHWINVAYTDTETACGWLLDDLPDGEQATSESGDVVGCGDCTKAVADEALIHDATKPPSS